VTMNSGNHWIVPIAPPDGGTWKGCTLRRKPDGGCSVLLSNNEVLVDTMLQLETTHERPLANHPSQQNVQDVEMTEFMVMGRCRHLVDGSPQANSQMAAGRTSGSVIKKIRAELRGKTIGQETFVTTAYIGFDSCMRGPVFARGAKDPVPTETPSMIASTKASGPKQPDNYFDLNDLAFKCDSASYLVGKGFIPHFAMMSSANIDVLKRLLTGTPLEKVLRAHTEIKEYFRHVQRLVRNLGTGNLLTPFVYKDPDIRHRLMPGWDLREMLEDESRNQSDNNRPLFQIACDATLLARQGKDDVLSGYRYHVALIESLEYPDELLSMLKDFAMLYPKDILPLRTLLLGCHLWADITGHRTLSMERFMEKREDKSTVPQVPDIPLAVCLIYYPHWLKWTEWMGLSEFPHPFRFMSQAVKSDMDNEAIGIDPDSIDQGRVYSLIARARSRVPLMDATHRVEIMPCHMPGSMMPPMFGPMVRRPEKVPLALTGLPDVQYLGLDSYIRPDTSKDGRPARMQSIQRTSKYATVILPRRVTDKLFTAPGKLSNSSEIIIGQFSSALNFNKRCMGPVSVSDSELGRPRKIICGSSGSQSENITLEFGDEIVYPVYPESELTPNAKYDEVLRIWAEVRYGVAHRAHHEGLQQLKNLREGERSVKAMRKIIKIAFYKEAEEIRWLEVKLRTIAGQSPLSLDCLCTDIPLAFGRLLGLRPPEQLMPYLWNSHFRPQCSNGGKDLYLRGEGISLALQESRNCERAQRMLLDELSKVCRDIWETPSYGWRAKLRRFLKDDNSFSMPTEGGRDAFDRERDFEEWDEFEEEDEFS
ncbi:hypothetical protein BBK36DRAFT_1112708, partial [Trichoderma citrinoviride]